MGRILKGSNFRFVLAAAISIPMVLTLAGCGAMVHNAVVKSLPSYEQTKNTWPSIPDGMGRVVIYYPRLPAAGFGLGGYDSRSVLVDDTNKTSLADQTFVYIDLKSGKHTVMYKGNMYKKREVSFGLLENELKFVEITYGQGGSPLPEVVSETVAEKALIEIKHGYKNSLAFDKQ